MSDPAVMKMLPAAATGVSDRFRRSCILATLALALANIGTVMAHGTGDLSNVWRHHPDTNNHRCPDWSGDNGAVARPGGQGRVNTTPAVAAASLFAGCAGSFY